MSRLFALAGMTLLAAVLLPAADVDGTWKGSLDSNGQSYLVTMQLKENGGGIVVGTVEGLSTPDPDIRDGKIAGDNVSFFINVDFEGESARLVFKGKVSGNSIDFNMNTDMGGWGARLTVKKS